MTDIGKSGLALLLGPSGTRPVSVALGSGSGAVSVSDVKLVNENLRQNFNSTNISVAKEILFITDFTATAMSGLDMREFGVFSFSADNTGSNWNREGFTAITFDGTNELALEISFQIF